MDERVSTESLNRRHVDCLLVNKVYDACSKRECLEGLEFALCNIPANQYTFLYTEFGAAIVERYECEPFFTEIDSCNARFKAVVAVPVFVVLRRNCDRKIIRVPARPIYSGEVQSDNKVRIPIETTFNLPSNFLRQGRFEPYAESYVETGCASNFSDNHITLTLGFFIITKAISPVQLKIPTFGFCDIPNECVEEDVCDVNFCEDFLDGSITPFPNFFPGCECD